MSHRLQISYFCLRSHINFMTKKTGNDKKPCNFEILHVLEVLKNREKKVLIVVGGS